MDDLILFGVAVLAVIAPLILIPFTFRWAGGALGAIGNSLTGWRANVMQNTRRRASERTGARRQELLRKARNERLFKGSSRIDKFGNWAARRITNPRASLPEVRGFGWLGGGRARGLIRENQAI